MKKLICGPMATLSHEAFRRVVEKFGFCDEYYTEMIHAPSLLHGGQFEKYYLMNGPCPQKIVWQLTGQEEDSIAEAVPMLCEKGGIGIDLNMGCCAPEIYKSGAGIAWMIKPRSQTMSMVRRVRDAIDKNAPGMRLSVKLRLGDEDFKEDEFYSFCRALCDNGTELVVLHPRTRKEKLSRPPRWYYAERLVQKLSAYKKDGHDFPVILNGNITDAESAKNALAQCPSVSGIMISRAAVTKPWIFRSIAKALPGQFCARDCEGGPITDGVDNRGGGCDIGPVTIDRLQTGIDFLDMLRLYQPPEFFKTRMQRFFTYYCGSLSFSHYIQSKMLNAADYESAKRAFSEYFEKCPDDRYLTV